MITLTNPKINGRLTSGTYKVPEESVYFMFGNASKTTIESSLGQFYVADDIANYNTGFKELSPGTMMYGARNITAAIKLMEVYVNKETYLGCFAKLDNSNSITVSYEAVADTIKAIFKLTHNLSWVVLYENAGYGTDDFTNPDMEFPDNDNLTQEFTETILTGYMGQIDVDIKLQDNVLAVTTDSTTRTLGGGTPATVLFGWGSIVCKGVVGVGSIPYYVAPRVNTIKQSNTNRTFMYNPEQALQNTTTKFIEYYVRGQAPLRIFYT